MGLLGPLGPGGFRRRGRRRGLIVGTAVGASMANKRAAAHAQQAAAQPEAAPVDEQGNDIEQLKQLAQLKDQGILTQEEFDAKKKQILGL